MQRINNTSQKTVRRNRGRKNTRGYQPGPNHVYQIRNGPVRAPLLPKEFSVSLVDRFTVDIGNQMANPYTWGMVEYLNRVPTYLSEFYTIYKYSRVTCVDLEVTLCNTHNAPIDLIIGVVPAGEASTVTAPVLEQKPGSIRSIASAKGGRDKVTLRKSFDPAVWFGNPYQTNTFWVDATQAANTLPLESNEPVIVVFPSSTNGGVVSYYLNVRATYHIQLFDLRTATNQ